jgi:hypothetical protein
MNEFGVRMILTFLMESIMEKLVRMFYNMYLDYLGLG